MQDKPFYQTMVIFYAPDKEFCLFINIGGKRKNAGNQHFLLFPQCFLDPIKEKMLSAMLSIWTILLSSKELTLYHTIPTFNHLEEGGFWKHFGKRRKCWLQAFSPFPKMFSTIPKANFNFLIASILSSSSSLNLDWSKIFSFGKDLTLRINVFENIVGNTFFCLFSHNFFSHSNQNYTFKATLLSVDAFSMDKSTIL